MRYNRKKANDAPAASKPGEDANKVCDIAGRIRTIHWSIHRLANIYIYSWILYCCLASLVSHLIRPLLLYARSAMIDELSDSSYYAAVMLLLELA